MNTVHTFLLYAVFLFIATGCDDTFIPLSRYEEVKVRIDETLGLINAGESIDFSCTVSGSAEPFGFYWDFDEQALESYQKDPGEIVFNTPGDYYVTVTVTDDSGRQDTDRIKIGTGKVKFVSVPQGVFDMGAHAVSEISNGLPVHRVQLSAFRMSTYEVRNDLYGEFLNDNGNSDAQGHECININNSRLDYDSDTYSVQAGYEDHPVTWVSWYGANAFCGWLSVNYLGNYRLPSEAQWEYAARGGDYYYKYPWGNDTIDDTYGNYNSNVDDTTPVGTYETGKNSYGLYDMAGNAWEWCLDWYSDSYYEECFQRGTMQDPEGPYSGQKRVRRGGSWVSNEDYLHTAFRFYRYPADWYHTVGFRIVCTEE